MNKLFTTLALLFLSATAASATTMSCERLGNSNNYRCTGGGVTYEVQNAASAEAAANAIAAQQQGQGQQQGQSQSSDNSNSSENNNSNSNSNSVNNSNSYSSNYTNESIALSTPAGGGCTWGVNIGLPGTGGAGICGTTKNAAAGILAQIADQIGNPCLAENKVAIAAFGALLIDRPVP